MEELKSIVGVLSKKEISRVRKFLGFENDAEDQKRGVLFNAVLEKKVSDDQEAAKLIYGKAPDSAYSHLKSRLKKDIMTILLLEKADFKVDRSKQNALDVKKAIIQGELLLVKGAEDAGVKFLEKALQIAVKHDLFNEAVYISDKLRMRLGNINGLKSFYQYKEVCNSNLQNLLSVTKAKELVHELHLKARYSQNELDSFKEEMKNNLKVIKTLKDSASSPLVTYKYYQYSSVYFDLIEDYPSAIKTMNGFLDFLKNEKSVSSNVAIAGCNMNLAEFYVKNGENHLAMDHAEISVEMFKTGMMNELMALRTLFYSYFRNKNYEEATHTLDRAFSHPRLKSSSFQYGRWCFYKAGFEFMKGNFDQSIDALNLDSTLSKDKSGWMFGYKLLEILNFIEKEEWNYIEFRIEALRKHIQKHKEKSVTRFKTIFKILHNFVRNDYDFDQTYKGSQDELFLLINGSDDHRWDPMGFEIIRFDEWFDSKLHQQKSHKKAS